MNPRKKKGIHRRKPQSPPRIGGLDAPSKTLERRGRGGHFGLTTPSALSKVASRLFLDAQPPLLSQEGTNAAPTSSALKHHQVSHIIGLKTSSGLKTLSVRFRG